MKTLKNIVKNLKFIVRNLNFMIKYYFLDKYFMSTKKREAYAKMLKELEKRSIEDALELGLNPEDMKI